MPWPKAVIETVRTFTVAAVQPHFDSRRDAVLYLRALTAFWAGLALLFIGFALDPDRGSGDPVNVASTIAMAAGFVLLAPGLGLICLLANTRPLRSWESRSLGNRTLLMGGVREAARWLGWSRRRTAILVVTLLAGVSVGAGYLIIRLIVA